MEKIMEKTKEQLIKLSKVARKELIPVFAAVICGLLLTAAITKEYSEVTSDNLAKKFIRLHVLANSNSEADQNLKLKVRDGVMELLSESTSGCGNIEDTRGSLVSSFDDIKAVAERVIKEEGYNYDASVSLSKTNFPTKHYGDFVLMAGVYEALRIEIGAAKGDNWWCVVYPPLCFVDVATGNKAVSGEEAKTKLKKVLTDNEYKLVAENNSLPVKVKFKTVEIWQERKLAKEAKKELAKEMRY